MLSSDVKVFLSFFFIYLATFFFPLYIVYPRAGNATLNVVEDFNDPAHALMAMFDLGLTGTKFTVDLVDGMRGSDGFPQLNGMSKFALMSFYLFYVGCVIMLVIVLLRLLMAMMTTTYQGIMKQATLAWRLQFAKIVLMVELIWPSCLGTTCSGEPNPAEGTQVYYFQHYAPLGLESEGDKFLDITSTHWTKRQQDDSELKLGEDSEEGSEEVAVPTRARVSDGGDV
eukprot:4194339-Prymnesium_polylepis.1